MLCILNNKQKCVVITLFADDRQIRAAKKDTHNNNHILTDFCTCEYKKSITFLKRNEKLCVEEETE